METPAASPIAPPPHYAGPVVGRDVNARLAGPRPETGDAPPFWGEDGFGFDDLIDLLNPLQHIPIIGTLYRAITGDQMAAGPRILGGALFGGPLGAAVAAADAAIADETGRDLGSHVLAWAGIDDGSDAPVAVAEAGAASQTAAEAAAEAAAADDAAASTVVELAEAPPEAPPETLPELPAAMPPPSAALAESPPAMPRPGIAPPAAGALAAGAVPAVASRAPAPAPDPPALSERQWAMLTGAAAGGSAPPARPRTPAPAQSPADIAAAMARALDKYQALTSARRAQTLVE